MFEAKDTVSERNMGRLKKEPTAVTHEEGEADASSSVSEDLEWLSSLSEPELDLLISLKQLALRRAENAGVKDLSERFDLRILRALGCILLEYLKERFRSTSEFPNSAQILALLDRCGLAGVNKEQVGSKACGNDIENLTSPNPTRRKMWEGLCEEQPSSSKKRKHSNLFSSSTSWK